MAKNKFGGFEDIRDLVAKDPQKAFVLWLEKTKQIIGELKESGFLSEPEEKSKNLDLDKSLVDAVQKIAKTLKGQKSAISKRREILSSSFIAFGNLALASLFFGDAFGGFSFDPAKALAGGIVWTIAHMIAYHLLKEKNA